MGLLDAGSLLDPLIGGIDQARKVLIRDDPIRKIGSAPANNYE